MKLTLGNRVVAEEEEEQEEEEVEEEIHICSSRLGLMKIKEKG
jgi:hypothetical protein